MATARQHHQGARPAQTSARVTVSLRAFVLSAVALVLTACADEQQPVLPIEPPPPTPELTVSTVLNGLASPWDLAFAPDGSMFFTEKCLGLSVRRPDGTTTRLFGAAGASLLAEDLVCEGQSGMLGVALHPDFPTERLVYVFMASNTGGPPRSNRVVRLLLNPGWTAVSERLDVVTDIAFKDQSNAVGGAGAHSGGRLRFGPDGFLYIGTGDNHHHEVPQSPNILGGKVLRVTELGDAAPGNSSPPGFDPRIFTYGHRNVQGLAFHPRTGRPYIAEHGPNHSDEVTALMPGGNGGWDPKDRPGLNCPSSYCGYGGSAATMPMTDRIRFPDAMQPLWTNNALSQGLGPATFLTGPQWLAWEGRLILGIMGARRLVLLELSHDGQLVGSQDVQLPPARYRALTQGPDGSLYLATDGGEVWRLIPSAPKG